MLITDVTYKIIFINFFTSVSLQSAENYHDVKYVLHFYHSHSFCFCFVFVFVVERHMQRPANNLPKAGGFAFFFLQLRTWTIKNIILLFLVEGK